MKTSAIGTIAVLVLAGGGLFAQTATSISAHGNRYMNMFTGEITDSFCAVDGQHNGVTRNDKNTSKANCTLTCVKLGGAEFVLYNPNTKRTYKLNDQEQSEAFAGENVIVAGTYDMETGTINVAKITPVIQNAF
jgi:hypothetical protein